VPTTRFDEVAEALDGFEIFVITDRAEATPLADARDRLMGTHQTWIREPATGSWRLDVFREPSDGETWICRREPSIRMPYERLIEWTDDGIPDAGKLWWILPRAVNGCGDGTLGFATDHTTPTTERISLQCP